MMLKKQNKKITWLIIFGALYITGFVLFCSWDYHHHKDEIIQNVDHRLYHNVLALKHIIPEEVHERAIKAETFSVKEDKFWAEKLTHFVEETGLKFAYTVIKQNDQLYFVFSDLTLDPETQRGTYYYYPYDDAALIFLKAFEGGNALYSTVKDRWGTVRTVILPVVLESGTTVLFCVDYDISYINQLLKKNVIRIGLIALFFFFFTIVIVNIYRLIEKSHILSLKESEERYRSVFQNSIGGFFQCAPDKSFITVNRSFAKILGFESPEELLGESVISHHYCSVAKDADYIAKVLDNEGTIENYEFKARKKDKSDIWVSINIWAVYGGDDSVIRFEGNLEEITERKRAEEEINRLNQFQESVIDNASIWLNVLDPIGNVLVWNKAAEAISGYTKEDFIGNSKVWELLYPDEEYRSNIFKTAAAITNEGKDVEDFQTIIRCKDKSEKHISWYSRRFVDKDGKALGAITLGRDITSFKETEEALRKSEEKLMRSKKMESLGLLAGGVAHDLNNVLSGIVSYPELILLDLPEDSKYRKPIEIMRESGFKASEIVQDLLTIARGVAIKRKPHSLSKIVESYLSSPEFEKLQVSHPDISVTTHFDEKGFKLSGSSVHLNKVVMNLVSNAVEAVAGRIGSVVLSTWACSIERPIRGYDDVAIGEYIAFSVKDNGLGISKYDLEHIFEPFYSTKEMGRSGTGLGLAVVWNIVQDHKGYIDVHTDNGGTTFELFFPITREEPLDEVTAVSLEQYFGSGQTILVVDDIEIQRTISCKMLETLGYKAIAVSSGEEALEYLQENSIDLVLLDMIMAPGINGCITYEQILKIHPQQKAVVVSGFAETEDVQKTLELGAGRFIKKPFSLKELAEAINMVISVD